MRIVGKSPVLQSAISSTAFIFPRFIYEVVLSLSLE